MLGWFKRLRARKQDANTDAQFDRHLAAFIPAQRAVFNVRDIHTTAYRDKYMSDTINNRTLFAHLDKACDDLTEEIFESEREDRRNEGKVIERCAEVANLAVMIAARNANGLDKAAKVVAMRTTT